MLREKKAAGAIQIDVYYKCECGTEVDVPRDHKIGHCVIVYTACEVICLDCGRNMKLEVFKTVVTEKTEVL